MYKCFSTLLFCLLFVHLCLGVIRWTRENPHIVEDGAFIDRNSTHISFYEPSGKTTHYHLSEYHATPGRVSSSAQSASDDRKRDSSASGWVSSFWAWGTSYTYFYAQWTVPNPPTSTKSNIVFFFNSLEGLASGGGSGSDILQPVLQFNNGVSGWTLASWYGSSQYTEATPIHVNVGDTITGIIQLNSGTWYILGYVNGVLVSTLKVSQSAFPVQNTAQWALEVYNMPDCTYYPPDNKLALTNIILHDQGNVVANPSFSTPATKSTGCNAAGFSNSAPSIIPQSATSPVLTITWQSTKSVFGSPIYGTSGVDIPNGDLSTTTASSAQACARACDNNANCKGWSWDSQGKSSCWLKSTVEARIANANRVSGVKPGQIGVDRAGGDLSGTPITLGTDATASDCAAYCDGNAACESWSFSTCNPKQCWLKGSVVTTTAASNCRTSGVKGVLFTNHAGGDLSHSVLADGADATQCAAKCASTSGCTSWAYTYPGPTCSTANTCWLKSGALTTPTVDVCSIVGRA